MDFQKITRSYFEDLYRTNDRQVLQEPREFGWMKIVASYRIAATRIHPAATFWTQTGSPKFEILVFFKNNIV